MDMLDTKTWGDGEVGLVLGGRVFWNMCGDVYDDGYMDNVVDDLYRKIIKIIKKPVKGVENKTDVFLTHAWGKELGMDNHVRVAEVNRRLQARGLTTWFDSEQLEGNVKKQTALGIDNAQCVVAFITKRYIDKVGGFNAEDNCQLEFNYAARRKTASKMIPVVMEERVRNTMTWDGEVGLVLGGRLYVDMCGNVYDDGYMDNVVDDLYSKIIKIIKKPVKGVEEIVSITIPSSQSDSISSQQSPPPPSLRQTSKNSLEACKPLTELTIEEVSLLLESCNLSKYVKEMKQNEVDGETLSAVENDEELKELGITLAPKARVFFRKVEEYKVSGVPVPAQLKQVVSTSVTPQKMATASIISVSPPPPPPNELTVPTSQSNSISSQFNVAVVPELRVEKPNALSTSSLAPHDYYQGECRICSSCSTCTGYGSGCVNCRSRNRAYDKGQNCGCGRGRSGCRNCGQCESCGGTGITCSGVGHVNTIAAGASGPFKTGDRVVLRPGENGMRWCLGTPEQGLVGEVVGSDTNQGSLSIRCTDSRSGSPGTYLYSSTQLRRATSTTPCRFFRTSKGCTFGDRCRFEH